MPRRRLEPLPPDRLALVLGMPSPAPPRAALPQQAGWVPQRTAVARLTVQPRARGATGGPLTMGSAVGQAKVVAKSAVPAPAVLEIGRHRRPAPPKPAILTVPVALRGVQARPRRVALQGALLLLVTAAVILGIRLAWARSSAQPQPIAAAAHSPPGGLVARTVPAAFASTGVTRMPTAAGVLMVHVVGQVRRPAVVRLPAGARVLDAVHAAGGAKLPADLRHLNLARPVADGEQIVVPKPGEAIAGGGPPGTGGAGAGGSGQGSGAGAANGLVDLNTADASALDSLPGVGPVLSQRILDWRTQHGRFSAVDELGEVSGIGDKLLAQIGPKVRV